MVQTFERDAVLIGRGPHNDVSLDLFEDATVSTHHAEIRLEEGEFVLYDMGSLNGTRLNGFPVRRQTLKPGDEIWLGRRGPRLTVSFDPGAGRDPAAWSRPSGPSEPAAGGDPGDWAAASGSPAALTGAGEPDRVATILYVMMIATIVNAATALYHLLR